MSHWTTAKLSIKNPNVQLLRQALQVMAEELGGELVENFEVHGWRRTVKAMLAIKKRLPYGNGYGVNISPVGEIEVFFDEHGAGISAEEFAARLTQYYTALAVSAAAQQLGFTVQSVQQLPQGILIDLAR